MKLYRHIYKYNWVLITFWSLTKYLDKSKFCIMCHGCPSHPLDHVPTSNMKLLQDWRILVYANYLWTWWSDWVCDFENSVDTILIVVEFLSKWEGYNVRSDNYTQWYCERIIMIWASYWGSVVLKVLARTHKIDLAVVCSPVIDWAKQPWLKDTANFLRVVYNNLWRVKEETLLKFENGNIDLNPQDDITMIKQKKILLIHDKHDPQIDIVSTEEYYSLIENWVSQLVTQDNSRHILLHHLDEDELYISIKEFISI